MTAIEKPHQRCPEARTAPRSGEPTAPRRPAPGPPGPLPTTSPTAPNLGALRVLGMTVIEKSHQRRPKRELRPSWESPPRQDAPPGPPRASPTARTGPPPPAAPQSTSGPPPAAPASSHRRSGDPSWRGRRAVAPAPEPPPRPPPDRPAVHLEPSPAAPLHPTHGPAILGEPATPWRPPRTAPTGTPQQTLTTMAHRRRVAPAGTQLSSAARSHGAVAIDRHATSMPSSLTSAWVTRRTTPGPTVPARTPSASKWARRAAGLSWANTTMLVTTAFGSNPAAGQRSATAPARRCARS